MAILAPRSPRRACRPVARAPLPPARFVSLSLAVLLLTLLATTAQAKPNPRYASIVIDAASGEVLSAANADAPRYPASLTKMMTLYLLFEALDSGRLSLNDRLAVSAHAADQPPTKLWLKTGGRIAVKDAILAMIVRSANDVAVVVAENLARSEPAFARRMTARARALGMNHTVFRNASGLPDDAQVTTARDMATLSMHLMRDFPQYYGYFARTEFRFRGKTIPGHNNLLDSYPGTDGLKTGYINASGFNVATSAVHDGRRIVSVVMGGFTARSRDAHMARLLDRGFVRASLMDGNDWVAKTALFDGPGQAARRAATATTVAMAEAPSARADSAVVGQGDAGDPIRALIAQAKAGDTPGGSAVSAAWAIQVGAFSTRHQAQSLASRAAAALAADLRSARPAVMAAEGDASVFRARVVDLRESQARRSCQQLQQQGMECVVVASTR
ncbi:MULTISPECIES: D-alanyl-D-alanine carboxypeptidase family protein [Modicisalibacter]|uniref:D-alanyl-D-alanine carboxypeptidase n=1 Tax=Modicisalibacter tunisiensis TaxID=390637 RepID=A0ABS7X5L8_9GAMM|nr:MULTISPECIES: D-alanyl-D-alanine carboxypeptidase family protein [Modicisalibacter]MBZ9537347.1 D-alanyl-D-alanine carboxypeptidase [Modicisalibacter tunisiensis]MBZ9569231.1 D-alanyl-D-alanine carboxypeptidase [Modicisalibacter tunisiensis]